MKTSARTIIAIIVIVMVMCTGCTPEQEDKTNPGSEDVIKSGDGQEETVTMKVYVNGMKVDTDTVTLDASGEVKVTEDGIKQIFRNAQTTGKTNSSLQDWANNLGYSYVQNGMRIYMSDEEGYAPVEINCYGKVVDFPDQQPFVTNGLTMAPVRDVVEMLGCTVEWKNGVVEIKKQDKTIVLFIGATTYIINGEEFALDMPAQIKNGRTIVPLRFIAEELGYDVTYNGDNAVKVVSISEKK